MLYKIADIPILEPYQSKIHVSKRFYVAPFCFVFFIFLFFFEFHLCLDESCHLFLCQELIEKAETQPKITIGVLVAIAVIFVTLFFKILFGGKKPVSAV